MNFKEPRVNPGCLSRIPDLGFPIPDPLSNNNNKRGEGEKLLSYLFFIATKFTKIDFFFYSHQIHKNLNPLFLS